MGLSHDSANTDESYTVLFGIRVWGRTSTKNSDPISTCCLDNEITNEERHRLWLQEMEAFDDKRLHAQQQIELYQVRITRAFNKKVKEQTFKKGDLVLTVRRLMVMTHKTKEKFQLKWEGSFVAE